MLRLGLTSARTPLGGASREDSPKGLDECRVKLGGPVSL